MVVEFKNVGMLWLRWCPIPQCLEVKSLGKMLKLVVGVALSHCWSGNLSKGAFLTQSAGINEISLSSVKTDFVS